MRCWFIEGEGFSIINGQRFNWHKSSTLHIPFWAEHQHFNTDPDKPSVWMAFIHLGIQDYVASEMTQTQVSPEYKKAQETGGA